MKAKKWCLLYPTSYFLHQSYRCMWCSRTNALLRECTFRAYWKWSFSLLKEASLTYHANLIRKYKNYNIKFKFSPKIRELATLPGAFQTTTTLKYRIGPVQNSLRRGKSHSIPEPIFIIFFPGFPPVLSHHPKKKPKHFHRLLSTVLIYSTAAVPLSAALAALRCWSDSHFPRCIDPSKKRKGFLCTALLLISTVPETGSLHAFTHGLKKEYSREEKQIYIIEKIIQIKGLFTSI